MEPGEFGWRAPEFEYREKTALWYWVTIGAALTILALAIWQKNFLFGVFVVLAEVMLIVWGNQEPRMVDFKLTQDGLRIDDRKTYDYKEMESFAWDDSSPGDWASLVFKFKKHLRPKLKISFPKTQRDQVKMTLRRFATEIIEAEWENSLLDSLERLIRF